MKCRGLKACTRFAREGMANSSVSMMDRRDPVLWWCRLWMWRHWAPRWWCRADPATSCHPANEYSGHQPHCELFSQTFLHLHQHPHHCHAAKYNVITYNVTRVTSHVATNQYTQHPAFLRHRLLLRAADLQMGGGGEHCHQCRASHISHQLYCLVLPRTTIRQRLFNGSFAFKSQRCYGFIFSVIKLSSISIN